jgi:hypothetical protein
MQCELRVPVAELLTARQCAAKITRAILRQTADFTSRHRWPVAPTAHGHTVPVAASVRCERDEDEDENSLFVVRFFQSESAFDSQASVISLFKI